MYVLCAGIHFTFSVVTVTRVAGMIYQYSSAVISRECLKVDNGYLIQTPFAEGCLNVFDRIILVGMCVILVMFIFIIFFVILHISLTTV